MLTKSKLIGVLRSVLGIYREGVNLSLFAPNGGEAYLGRSGLDSIRVGGGSATLGDSITDFRKGGFASFTISGALVTEGGTAGAATTATPILVKKTGIADNSATNVITVTVPNANHSAGIEVDIVSSNGGADAFESTRVAKGYIAVARTSGAATVAVAATLSLTAIATVSLGATHTLAYGVTSMTGANNATQTFSITVTIDDSGNLGSNQAIVRARIINSEASGITMAAA
jgi:hypothetical protein